MQLSITYSSNGTTSTIRKCALWKPLRQISVTNLNSSVYSRKRSIKPQNLWSLDTKKVTFNISKFDFNANLAFVRFLADKEQACLVGFFFSSFQTEKRIGIQIDRHMHSWVVQVLSTVCNLYKFTIVLMLLLVRIVSIVSHAYKNNELNTTKRRSEQAVRLCVVWPKKIGVLMSVSVNWSLYCGYEHMFACERHNNHHRPTTRTHTHTHMKNEREIETQAQHK